MLGPRYPGVPHDWTWIVEQFGSLASADAAFEPMADVVRWLAASPYRTAGLCAVMSMHDLIVAPSADVLVNPHLVIAFVPGQTSLHLRYEDGSRVAWSCNARPDEVREILERFFVKRARWYRRT